ECNPILIHQVNRLKAAGSEEIRKVLLHPGPAFPLPAETVSPRRFIAIDSPVKNLSIINQVTRVTRRNRVSSVVRHFQLLTMRRAIFGSWRYQVNLSAVCIPVRIESSREVLGLAVL